MDSLLAVKDATHYFTWYFFNISCCWKNIIMLSHLNLKSTIPVQTTAYARKLHLNSVTDRLMQFQITLKLWEAHTQEKRINSRFPLVSFPLQYTSHKYGYGKLPITVPLLLRPQDQRKSWGRYRSVTSSRTTSGFSCSTTDQLNRPRIYRTSLKFCDKKGFMTIMNESWKTTAFGRVWRSWMNRPDGQSLSIPTQFLNFDGPGANTTSPVSAHRASNTLLVSRKMLGLGSSAIFCPIMNSTSPFVKMIRVDRSARRTGRMAGNHVTSLAVTAS